MDEYNLPKMDILKVGHHGSKISTDLKFLKTIMPKYVIISAASKNIYGYPDKIGLDNLTKVGSQNLKTSINGSIKFIIKKFMLAFNLVR